MGLASLVIQEIANVYPSQPPPPSSMPPSQVTGAPSFHPQTGHPQTGHPQTGHPQTGHPQTGHPQTGHPQSAYPNAGYYPPQPPAPAPRRTSPVVWVLAAMGLMAVLGGVLGTCGVVAGLMALGASSDGTGGVILGTQVPDKTVDALIAKKLLGPNETLLAYHDTTVRLDMSELTFITTTRVVHSREKTVATMDFRDITKITHRSEGIIGDVVEIASEDGRTMRVEIAPLNGGESYVTVLEDAWKKHKPEAKVVRPKR